MRNALRLIGAILLVSAHGGATSVMAQPAPSFTAPCDKVHESVKSLDLTGDPYIVIQVHGALTKITDTDVVSYLEMCDAPDPHIVCVAYRDHNRQLGETVHLAGSYYRRGPDLIILDQCLSYTPE